jgi:O-antigen biosynthesis protein
VNAHPANYQRWLAAVVTDARAKPAPEERLVFINAWNEWAEGAYLEPDQQYGRQFLEATQRALDGS